MKNLERFRKLVPAMVAGLIAVSVPSMGIVPAVAAEKGTVNSSPSTVKQMLKSLGLNVRPACAVMRQVQSDRDWGYYVLARPPQSGCPEPGEGGLVYVVRSGSLWSAVPVAGDADCRAAKAALKGAGAQAQVVKVLARANGC